MNLEQTKCKVCGNDVSVEGYAESMAERLNSVGICHSCDSWMGDWKDRNSESVVRINGQHYRIGRADSKYKGMGGQKLTIKFFDGRTVEVSNLWHQGRIPTSFRNVLIDNAEFVGNAK